MKSSDAAHANCASADAGAMHNTQAGYISYRQGPPLHCIAAWVKQINSCANVQPCIDIAKLALDVDLNLAVLHCPKCKAMHIDTPNSVANIKHQVHCTNSSCKHILLYPDS